jgi:hypothetical protein
MAIKINNVDVIDNSRNLVNTSVDAARVNSGTLADARIPNLAASKITSGVFPTDRIASNAVTSAKLATGADEMQWVAARIQQTSATGVGSIIVAWNITTTAINSRGTISGASLRYSTGAANFGFNENMFSQRRGDIGSAMVFPEQGASSLPGTWRNLGARCRGTLAENFLYAFSSLWIRIS